MFNRTIKIIWNSLAVFGLVCLVTLTLTGVCLIKRTSDHSGKMIFQKVFAKIGMDSGAMAQKLEVTSSRPLGLVFPDPGDPGWKGIGARNDRVLDPVAFDGDGRPVPNSWRKVLDQKGYSSQISSRSLPVTTQQELRSAIKGAEPGDIIVLKPGVYSINAYSIEATRPGTRQLPICVRGEKAGQSIIELNSTEGFLIAAPYWIFENIEFKGTNPSHNEGEHAFHIIGKANGFVLRNCRLHEFNAMIKANGIKDKSGQSFFPDDALIENNSFYNSTIRNTDRPVTFIDVVGADNWLVSGNFIADFSKGEGDNISYAAFVKGNASNTIFEANLVIGEYRHTGGIRVGLSFGGGGTGKPYFRDGNSDVEHKNGMLRNNVIAYCPDAGIYLNRSANTKIFNNLLYKTMGIDVRYPESTARIENTYSTSRVSNRDGGVSTLDHNVILKEKAFGGSEAFKIYVNPDQLDFSFKGKGVILGQGKPLPDVFEDMCGNRRKNIPDIGPFEYENARICTLIGI